MEFYNHDYDKSAFWEKSEDQYKIQNSDLKTEKQFIKVLVNSLSGSYATTKEDIGQAFITGYSIVVKQSGFSPIVKMLYMV